MKGAGGLVEGSGAGGVSWLACAHVTWACGCTHRLVDERCPLLGEWKTGVSGRGRLERCDVEGWHGWMY